MARRPGRAQAREFEERFKTHEQVSRVLSAIAAGRGIHKCELLHEIVSEFVDGQVHAAKLLIEAADCEGASGICGD